MSRRTRGALKPVSRSVNQAISLSVAESTEPGNGHFVFGLTKFAISRHSATLLWSSIQEYQRPFCLVIVDYDELMVDCGLID